MFIFSSGQDNPCHTWFCEESWETPEWYLLLIASRKPFLVTSQNVILPHLDLNPPGIKENSTLFSSNQNALSISSPHPTKYLLHIQQKGLGLEKREKEQKKERTKFCQGFFFFFFLPLQPMNKIGWYFQQSKAVMPKCPSASLYGVSALRLAIVLTTFSGGRGSSVNPHETTRELCKTI